MKKKLQSIQTATAYSFMQKRVLLWILALFSTLQSSAQITVSSLAELADAAAQSGQVITMTPGVYNMTDYLTPAVIASSTPADAFGNRAMIRFSGSDNTFDFSNVTINVDTQLLNDLGGNVIEFHLTGNHINFKGLTVTDIGNYPTAGGGQSLVVTGNDIVVQNVRLNMNGSSPYGYGDLLGKGGGSLVAMKKHSGLLVQGLNDSIIGCSIYSQSFGHLFFVQGGRNVLFQDCYAEAVTRTTDSMLAETSGPAFNLNFEAVYPNYNGDNVITPGYTKSLSECGFRTYGEGGGNITSGVTLINCTARNARVGFALEVGGPILIQNCEATGCEAGYNVSDVKIENSRGDAVNGPLLYLSGSSSEVDLELMPTLPVTTLHAIATVSGTNQKVSIKNADDATPRAQEHKIIVGGTRPTGTNPFSPLGSEATAGVILNNCTNMPVEVMPTVSSSVINSFGTVTNNGTGNTVDQTKCTGTITVPDTGNTAEGLIDENYNIAASSTNPDPFYGWNPDLDGTFGYMAIDEVNQQLVCTYEDNGAGYIRFYLRKADPSLHKLNANNYPILVMKGKRPANYDNFVLNLKNNTNGTGNDVQFKDGKAVNGVETLAISKLLPGTTDVYYWDLSKIMPITETWTLSGMNCVNTKEVNPVTVMKFDFIKTFSSLDALQKSLSTLSTPTNEFSNKELQLFPNPSVNGSFECNVENSLLFNIKIYNMQGQLVLEENYPIATQNSSIQHHLKAGIYLVKINNSQTTKLIVK
ncbi:T9SS type A sorting domain-containing protein [Flavobacterium fluviatile]|uniref:T9SS type A sorting domain-containing protein n=1 Tax=Flavobacterium fluviatile TaxID=1862387 RepID=UPI0013D6830D|nr:T9SS type A sorting domain-containing protein [Flavobacterium fluviatile]